MISPLLADLPIRVQLLRIRTLCHSERSEESLLQKHWTRQRRFFASLRMTRKRSGSYFVSVPEGDDRSRVVKRWLTPRH
jgi:hypothetical protein